MRKFHNPLAPKANRLQAKSTEIKGWVREVMELPDDTPITVAELACPDEGCPDIETVIGVLKPGTPIVMIRVHASMRDVSRYEVAEAARNALQVEHSQ